MKIMTGSLMMLLLMLVSGCALGPPGKPVVIAGTVESVRPGYTGGVRQVPLPTKKFKHLFILQEGLLNSALDYLYVNDFKIVKKFFSANKHYPSRYGYWLEVKGDRQWFKDWGDGQPEELCWDNPYRWLYAKDENGRFVGESSDPVLIRVEPHPFPSKIKSSKCLSSS